MFSRLLVVDVVAPVDSRSKQLEAVSSCKRGGERLQILCFFSGDTYRLFSLSERVGGEWERSEIWEQVALPLTSRPCREVLVELPNL